MLTTSVQSATRARRSRLGATCAVTRTRGFHSAASCYYFRPHPCRGKKRNKGAPRNNSTEDPDLPWPLGKSLWPLENTYRAIVKEIWSTSQLRPSVQVYYKKRSSESGHGTRQGADEYGSWHKMWAHRYRIISQQRNYLKQQCANHRESKSDNPSCPVTDTSSYSFYIDPITNRKVPLKSQDTEHGDQNGSRLGSEDPGRARDYPDAPQSVQNSGGHSPEAATSQSGHGQPGLSYNDSKKCMPTVDNASVMDNVQKPLEQDPPEPHDIYGKSCLQFDDLKPPASQLDENASASADESARFIYDTKEAAIASEEERRRGTTTSTEEHLMESQEPVSFETLETNCMQTHENTSLNASGPDGQQAFDDNTSDGKPAGYVEEYVEPERLHEFPYTVVQTEPGDFPPSTIDDLRQKYGNSEVKKYTVVRCEEPYTQPWTSAQKIAQQRSKDQERSIEHSQVTINDHGHEHLLSEASDIASKSIENDLGMEFLEKLRERQVDESVSPKHRAWLESMEQLSHAMRQDEILSDAADREAALAVRRVKARVDSQDNSETLTGNYARDFPEDFAKSWTQTLSSTPNESLENAEQPMVSSGGQSMDGGLEGGFGQPEPAKVQPALDRQHKTRATAEILQEPSIDTSSHELRNLETSDTVAYGVGGVESLNRAAGPGEVGTSQDNIITQDTVQAEEDRTLTGASTTLYKILAYDSTSQTISIAETSSLVGDFSSALSPAAALSRLSHPTKFFPHFASLEADGFEIVSGSGDVLVFRKARPSAAEREANTAETTNTSDSATNVTSDSSPPINPIDMTGRPKFMAPASANFASPTGYVAYPESEAQDLPPPPPRIKYNINLRREEPVYSGPKTRAYGGQEHQKKAGLSKRVLVGGVWVAGISYGLGVVSEYFATGGVDGTGPTGF